MRIIGLDIHRAFAQAVAWDDGKLKRLGRVDMRRPLLEAFAKKLSKEDVVVVEATGNAASVAAVIAPHVKKVVIANPKQVTAPDQIARHRSCEDHMWTALACKGFECRFGVGLERIPQRLGDDPGPNRPSLRRQRLGRRLATVTSMFIRAKPRARPGLPYRILQSHSS